MQFVQRATATSTAAVTTTTQVNRSRLGLGYIIPARSGTHRSGAPLREARPAWLQVSVIGFKYFYLRSRTRLLPRWARSSELMDYRSSGLSTAWGPRFRTCV